MLCIAHKKEGYMMAYDSGFVASIIKDDKVLRESSDNGTRTVRIPFNSEYKIRLQNKTDVRAYARVLIDGTEVHTGKFVLQPYSSFDLERFMLDGDLAAGRKLKFVALSNGDVQDPTAKENGLVEIIFEKEYKFSWLNNSNTLGGGILRVKSFGAVNSVPEGAAYTVNTSDAGFIGSSNCTYTPDPLTTPATDRGATVEGGQSSQQFQLSTDNFITHAPVSIKIQMRAPIAKKTWQYKNVTGGFEISHNDTKLSLVEEVTINPTHLVIKIPISQVQIGS